MSELLVFPDTLALTRAAAEQVVRTAQMAQTKRGHFTIALSGGTTPRALYRLLATDEYLPLIDWTQVYVFWGDERCVPPDHPTSNYHMAREALLDFVPIPIASIFRMYGEIEPTVAADAYEFRLRRFFETRVESPARARFDLLLLGLGDDAHTASLFPESPALDATDRWVAAHYVEKLAAWRLTLTPEALNAAVQTLVLVTGEGKADALSKVLHGERNPRLYPAQLIQPTDGKLLWMVDRAAASALPA